MNTAPFNCALKSGFETGIAYIAVVVAFLGGGLEGLSGVLVFNVVAMDDAFIDSVSF